jgi:ATP-dependent DNA ligase
MPLVRIPEPFDHDEWIYELKLDGFRALAFIDVIIASSCHAAATRSRVGRI